MAHNTLEILSGYSTSSKLEALAKLNEKLKKLHEDYDDDVELTTTSINIEEDNEGYLAMMVVDARTINFDGDSDTGLSAW